MTRLPGLTVTEIGYRRVAAQYEGPMASLLTLRTVDDVFLLLDVWHGVSRRREALSRLHKLSARLSLPEAVRYGAHIRHLPRCPSFSNSANFVGKRNYTVEEIKERVAAGVRENHPWVYHPRDDLADLNLRLFIEHETAHVGLRLGHYPLHRRPYKDAHVPGSLKPPIAAALVVLAEAADTVVRLLDPCCGAGTIAVEAALYGASVTGLDVSKEAIRAARTNAEAAGVQIALLQGDARTLPLRDASVDCIVSNLPWGQQVSAEDLRLLYTGICAEIRRTTMRGGRIVVLTSTPELLRLEGMQCDLKREISVFGQTPTVVRYRME